MKTWTDPVPPSGTGFRSPAPTCRPLSSALSSQVSSLTMFDTCHSNANPRGEMHEIIASNLDYITKLCREHRVARLDAFGSVLTEEFGPESDVDFLVTFDRDAETNAFRQYFEFKEAIEKRIGRPVDLVCADSMRNTVFRRAALDSSLSLFAA